MNNIIEWIQQNNFLSMSNKVIGALDPLFVFISIIILCTTLVTGGQPWTNTNLQILIPHIVPIVCGGFVFVLALAIGKRQSQETLSKQALVIAVGTVLSLSALLMNSNTAPFVVVPAFWIAFILKTVSILSSNLPLKSKHLPPAVASTLIGIIPDIAVGLVSICLTILVSQSASSLVSLQNTCFNIIGSYPVVLLSVMAICLIWTYGHHGANTVNKVMRPFWVPMILINLYAFTTTGKPAYTGVEGLITTFVWIGGSGGTLGLAFILKLFTKSQFMKQIAKESLVPGLFNINEPIIFGVPIMENKRYYIPFFLGPILMVSIAYWAINMGFVTFPAYLLTWIMPGPIAAYVGSYFDWRALLLALALILVSGLVYLPFILKHDKECLLEERPMN